MSWASPPSVQSISPVGLDPSVAADLYFRWVDRSLPFVRTRREAGEVALLLPGSQVPAIALKERPAAEGEAAFEVVGGYLVAPEAGGEFLFSRSAEGGVRIVLRGFTPRLPSWIYRASHALVHTWVMQAFCRWIEPPRLRGESS